MFILGIFIHLAVMAFMVKVVGVSIEAATFGFFLGVLVMMYGLLKAALGGK